MEKPKIFYQKELEKYTQESKLIGKRLAQISLFRVLIVFTAILGIYFALGNSRIILLIVILGLFVFFLFVSKYLKLSRAKELAEAKIFLNKEELRIAKRDFHHRATGDTFQDAHHFYSLDIDLFGIGSFYQYINRTATKEGSALLASLLKANEIKHIPARQASIKELASKVRWRQHFHATATLVKVETPATAIIDWLDRYTSFIPAMMSWLPKIFTGLSSIVVCMYLLGFIPGSVIGLWLIIGLFITGIYVNKINNLSSYSDKLKYTFRQYGQLLEQIEKESFSSPLLVSKQKSIESEQLKASAIFKQFSKHLDALDNRNNLLMALIINGLALSDIAQSYKIEKWISKYHNKVNEWFLAVNYFDAYNSLGNYYFNHPDYVFPSIEEEHSTTQINQLGHPLLDPIKRVDSDISIHNQEFFIVTGANMAGKSTFLRTISLHIVMANVGLPVCAHSSKYSPVKLITSMRTSDSLTDDSSYFFSELKRLKFIVDAIETEAYFIVLDEILKGTNSTDKAIGSKKFVEKLVASDATGIIATHDLSLCEIAGSLPEVKNYYFDASIIDDELHFDYTFKQGVCQNMNASFLLKKMNIV